MKLLSALVIPAVMLLVCAMLTFSKKATFDDFLLGTNEGIATCVKLLPTLIALLVAVSMLSASGFLDFAARLISPLATRLGIPADILPLVLTRPVSGSASSAVLAELYRRCGADSFAARVASVIAASGDTVLYISAILRLRRHKENAAYTPRRASHDDILRFLFLCRLLASFLKNRVEISPRVWYDNKKE